MTLILNRNRLVLSAHPDPSDRNIEWFASVWLIADLVEVK